MDTKQLKTQAAKKQLPRRMVTGANTAMHASPDMAAVLRNVEDELHKPKLLKVNVESTSTTQIAPAGALRIGAGQLQGTAVGSFCSKESMWQITVRLEEPSGEDLMRTEVYGHKTVTITTANNDVVAQDIVLVLPPDRIRLPPELRYECFNAMTNEPIKNFTVTLTNGNGQSIKIAGTPDALRSLSRELQNGSLQMVLESDRIESIVLSRMRFEDHTRSEKVEKLFLNPINTMTHKQIRAVLRWDAQPPDLDLHCVSTGGRRRNVYHGKKTDGELHLDIDVREGHGPETITVTPTADTTYAFYVCNYSKVTDGRLGKDNTAAVSDVSDDLVLSSATVTIYIGGQAPLEFCIPTSPVQDFLWWHVCNVVTSDDGCAGSPIAVNTLQNNFEGPQQLAPQKSKG